MDHERPNPDGECQHHSCPGSEASGEREDPATSLPQTNAQQIDRLPLPTRLLLDELQHLAAVALAPGARKDAHQ